MKHSLWMTAKLVILSCIVTTGFVFSSYATTNSENPPPAIKEHAEYLELQHMMIETAGEFDRSTGLHRFVLGSRYVNAFFEQREKLASLYQNYQNAKEPDPVLKKILIDIVNEQSTSIKSIIEKIDTLNAQDNDKQAQLEAQTDILIHEQVVARRNRILDQYLQALFVNTQYQQGLDLDHTSDVTYLEQKLQTYARYAADSVEALLDARENFLRVLGFANADVQTEINDKLQALEHKKVGAIETLAQRIQLMNSLSMDTQELSQFLVIARGKLSGDLLDADIIVGLS
ncbi:hypothetical protein, partial [Oleiphilus sp. HI0080]